MTIRDLTDLVIYAGAVAGALSAIGWLVYRVFVRSFVRWLREQIEQTRDHVVQARESAEAVQAEVTPNHGSSLKDAVVRTEVKLDVLGQRFADHLANHPGPRE